MSQPVHEPTGLYCQLMLSRLRVWFVESAYRYCCSGACIHIYAPSDSFVELDLVSSSMIQTVRIGTLLWYINGTFLFLGTALPRQSYFQTFFFFSRFWIIGSNKGLAGIFGTPARQFLIMPAVVAQINLSCYLALREWHEKTYY